MEMMSIPDPLSFALDTLAARGALIDRFPPPDSSENVVDGGDGEAMALLPPQLSSALGLGEELRLVGGPAAVPESGRTPCGMGTPLLEQLIMGERGRVSVAAARLDLERPREAQARHAGERFAVRNGLSDVTEVIVGEAVYLFAAVAYVAEADDRQEGLLAFDVECASGAVPDDHMTPWLDPLRVPSRLLPLRSLPGAIEIAAPHVARRAAHLARAAAGPLAESVARRQRREHGRICEYFSALIVEAKNPRRRADPAAVAAKVAHFVAEREAKLRDLDLRFRLRVSLVPAAVVAVIVPAASVRLRLRRRKAERELVLRLPAGARSLDAPPCDGCTGEAARPVLCDERLHLLCEVCAPNAEGRPHCPACRVRPVAARAD